MKKRLYRITRGVLFCCLAAALPAFAQDNHPQQNDHPSNTKQTQRSDHHAQQPGEQHHAQQSGEQPNSAARQQQEHNAGHAQPQRSTQERQTYSNTHAQPQTNRDTHHAQSQTDRGNNHAQPQQNHGDYHPQQQQNRNERPSPTRNQQYRANEGHRTPGSRPAQWGRRPSHRGSYQFRSNDRSRLHNYYTARLRAINRANRPVFRTGGYFPYAYIDYISPLPPELYGELPPPPPGYQMGYYDGYVVVYDPVTYFIASVIDLLQ